MKALLHSVRIAPKKLNLIARLVRGLSVPDATESLRKTNKKGARIVEKLLLSAVANASHNDKQDPQMMVIKTIVVNQGQAYRRGMPKARGQTRPYRKFLSHLEIVLGYAEEKEVSPAAAKRKEKASAKPKNPVKAIRSKTKKTDTSSDSSASSSSSVSS